MRSRAGPVTEISVFAENFPILTLQPGSPGRNFFDKIASLSQHSGQNDLIFVLKVFPLQNYTIYLY